MQRWFSARFRATPESAAWRHMLERSPVQGYLGCCHAIAGTDFITPTSGLRLAALGIASSEDGSTPPDLVRETTELIPGAQFRLIRGAGHIACVEAADAYAAVLSEFLAAQGHI